MKDSRTRYIHRGYWPQKRDWKQIQYEKKYYTNCCPKCKGTYHLQKGKLPTFCKNRTCECHVKKNEKDLSDMQKNNRENISEKIPSPRTNMPNMQKTKLYIALISIFLGGALYSSPVFASVGGTTSDSSSVITSDGASEGFGNTSYQDSKVIFSQNDSFGDPLTILSTTTAYTILSFEVMTNSGTDGVSLQCGGVDLLNANWSYTYTRWSWNSDVPLHCSSDLVLSSHDPFSVNVQYVPYDTRIKINNMTEIDWTQPIIVISILLVVLGWWIVMWWGRTR